MVNFNNPMIGLFMLNIPENVDEEMEVEEQPNANEAEMVLEEQNQNEEVDLDAPDEEVFFMYNDVHNIPADGGINQGFTGWVI